jgi:hypothetical protein
VPFDVSCHTQSLCTSPLEGLFAGQCAGGFENLGQAYPQPCKAARDSEMRLRQAGQLRREQDGYWRRSLSVCSQPVISNRDASRLLT